MNLVTLCDPAFQYICLVNRMARKGAGLDYSTVRNAVKSLFEQMAAKSKRDVGVSAQYAKVELPLLFFVDSMLAEGPWPWAAEWNRSRLAYERDELAGDEKFFDLLDQTLAETGEAADERLAIFYTCIGLGFSGWYTGQPEYLRRKMNDLLPRVRSYIDADEAALITPDTYQHTDTSNLPLPMSASVVPVLIAVVGCVLLVVVVNFYIFRLSSQDLNRALDAIVARDPAVQQAAKAK
jgi:type IV/VI secretion system ImpK/VasF family protein